MREGVCFPNIYIYDFFFDTVAYIYIYQIQTMCYQNFKEKEEKRDLI